MGSEKHRSSETSSDRETGRNSFSPESSKDGLGRSYECNFCKRGFTNAQALGGHMNIHRKDKAKAKQQKAFTKPMKDHLIVSSSNPFKSVVNEGVHEYLVGSGDHGYQFIPSNPNYFPFNSVDSELDNNHAFHDQEHLRVNLNLGIGSSEMEHGNQGSRKRVQEDWFENEVDLELRLGNYP